MFRDVREGTIIAESEAVRGILQRNIQLLQEQRLQTDFQPATPAQELQVHMSCQSLGRDQLPARLVEFVDVQYGGREMKIEHILAGTSFIAIHANPVSETHMLERNVSNLRVHVPEKEAALDTTVYLLPSRPRMKFGIQTFTLAEWVTAKIIPHTYTFEEKDLDPRVVEAIATMIPDPSAEKATSFFRRKPVPSTPPPHPSNVLVVGPNFETLRGMW